MPVPVSSVYDELMHYTTFGGLSGIISSGCIWATDANYLNDAREISHYFDVRLKTVIEPVTKRVLYKLAQDPEKLAEIVRRGGFDELINGEVAALFTSIRTATMQMNRPFVLSLCGARSERVRQSGLLSQWRGYGADGGFALVFDTKGIETGLEREAKAYAYLHVQIGDVFYEGIDSEIQPGKVDFEEMENTVQQGVERLIRERALPPESGDFYQAVTGLTCLFKHWGFEEEREVRVVAIPTPENLLSEESRPQKTIKAHTRNSVEVPYIELFIGSPDFKHLEKLPLKRVIIGPHRDHAQRTSQVRELLKANGYDVQVVESEIPYLGR